MDRFTQNLRRARKAAGLTQQQLADRLHVTRQSVSSWELGRTEPDLQTLTELAEVFGTDAGSLLGEAGRPAYPRLQKRFVTGFVVCAGLLLAVSGLELGLFAYWRKLLLHDYSPALYAALWKLFVPPLLWYASGLGAVCFFAMWSPVRCGKQARLALLLAALALGLPVLALMAQYLAVALGNLDGVRVWHRCFEDLRENLRFRSFCRFCPAFAQGFLPVRKGAFEMGFWFFMLAMNLIIPLSMIFLGKYFSKHAPGQINMLFGYRTARSMKNQDTWQFAHHYFGKLWFKMGLWLLVLTVAAMLPGLGKDAEAVGKLGGLLCLAQLPVMLYTIFPTERALKKTFDKDGNRKKT